jgi:hypothetical protein
MYQNQRMALGSNYPTGNGDTLFKYDVITQGLVLGVVLHQ